MSNARKPIDQDHASDEQSLRYSPTSDPDDDL